MFSNRQASPLCKYVHFLLDWGNFLKRGKICFLCEGILLSQWEQEDFIISIFFSFVQKVFFFLILFSSCVYFDSMTQVDVQVITSIKAEKVYLYC